MAQKSTPDLSGFDSLPDIARTSLPVVCALFGVSSATVWRRVHEGKIPTPIKDGQATRWIAEVRHFEKCWHFRWYQNMNQINKRKQIK